MAALAASNRNFPFRFFFGGQLVKPFQVVSKKPVHKLEQAVALSSFGTQGWVIFWTQHS